MATETESLRGKYAVLGPLLDERTRRLWAAAEARAIGRGGITRVAEATGMSRVTVRAGLRELESGAASPAPAGRLRGPGGGRKALAERDPGLVGAL
ncbi:MAG: ISAzo13 family transposase, partial [Gammaproteobacteria bacterium]|nr:ISAzo13 family transposase [Gammaproteobacteria bacterium]